MGGTLDNGIYLPDQGERNCYNGLKNNWDTLDNLIETVQALSSAGLTREIVNSLPTENIKTNVIYMLRNSQQSGDLYDEYMYINNAWEPIGTSATEMDNYYTKSETNALPAVASGITASKVTGYDSHVANTEVHITAAERSTWNGKQNALDTDQTAAVNSGVNATKVTGYDTHVANTVIHVTSSDKTAWNGKQDGLSQTQLNAVNSGVTDTKVTGYDTHVADSSAHVSSADRTAWNGKQNALTQTQLDNIAAVPNKANAADLATVATTGDYGDLLNAPTIPTVNNATLTIQKNGTDVATFTANASSNVTANLSIPTDTSDLTNGAGFLTQHNPIDNELSVSSENAVQNKVVTTALNGKAASSHTHAAGDINTGTFNIARIPDLDASKITSGTIDIARLPKGSLERLIKVADQPARYALTTDDVQLGDTVQQLDTGVMYAVTDVTKLDSADGYTEFTAGSATSVPWSGVTGKPSTFTPSSHTHGSITNDGKLGTASVALVTDANKNIAVSSVTATELGYLSGVTSAIQTQIAGKAPAVHTHVTSDVTDLLSGDHTWNGNNTYSKTVAIERSTDIGNFLALKNTAAELGSTPASATPVTIAFRDKNDDNLGYMGVYYDTDGSNHFRLYVRNKFTSGAPSTSGSYDYAFFGLRLNADKSKEGIIKATFRPYDNNTHDLGSSSYQWNNVYSKGYYYNGVAWGLDKENVWTADNTFSNSIVYFKLGSSGSYNDIRWKDNNGSHYATLRSKVNELTLGLQYSSASAWYSGASVNINNQGSVQIKAYDGTEPWTVNFTPVGVYPTSNNALELGTSTNKWKSLNGINPGALSLPQNVSMDIDRTNWNLRGGEICTITHTANCYVCVQIQRPVDFSIWAIGIGRQNFRASLMQNGNYLAMVWFPCIVGFGVTLYTTPLIDTPVDQREPDLNVQIAKYFPCQGNV